MRERQNRRILIAASSMERGNRIREDLDLPGARVVSTRGTAGRGYTPDLLLIDRECVTDEVLQSLLPCVCLPESRAYFIEEIR